MGQAEYPEYREDRQFDGEHEDLGLADELRADQVHHHHSNDQADADRLAGPLGRVPRQQSPRIAGESGAVQSHCDDPAEKLKHIEPAGDNAITETADRNCAAPPRLGYFAPSLA